MTSCRWQEAYFTSSPRGFVLTASDSLTHLCKIEYTKSFFVFTRFYGYDSGLTIYRIKPEGNHGSSVVRHLPLVLEVPCSIPACSEEKFRCPNTLSLVSFTGMTLDKCIVLQIGTLTGCPLCRESHPLCRLKNPTVI